MQSLTSNVNNKSILSTLVLPSQSLATKQLWTIRFHRQHQNPQAQEAQKAQGVQEVQLQEKGTWSEQVACGDVKPRPLSVLQIRPNNIVMHGAAKKHGL